MAALTTAASCARLPHAQQATRILQQNCWHTSSRQTSGFRKNKSQKSRQTQKRKCSSSKDTQPKLTRKTLQDSMQEAIQQEKAYLLKILAASMAGAAIVKFGSLIIETPFKPSLLTAIGIITLPCAVYSLLLYNKPE